MRHPSPRVHRRLEGHVGRRLPTPRRSSPVRQDEQRAAAKALGATGEVVFLGWRRRRARVGSLAAVPRWRDWIRRAAAGRGARPRSVAPVPTPSGSPSRRLPRRAKGSSPPVIRTSSPSRACPTTGRRRCCCWRPTRPTTLEDVTGFARREARRARVPREPVRVDDARKRRPPRRRARSLPVTCAQSPRGARAASGCGLRRGLQAHRLSLNSPGCRPAPGGPANA